MIKFEKISKFKDDTGFKLPERKTQYSAGYDFEVAEDIIIPPYQSLFDTMYFNGCSNGENNNSTYSLADMADYTKSLKTRPSLVSTGVKCYLDPDTYLELSVRSSTPLKYWLVLANAEGIIDSDYADNPDNEGEIFFQVINLSPYNISLKKGDIIGQGIIKKYIITKDDTAKDQRLGGFGSTSNA